MIATRPPTNDRWLDDHVDAWVAADLITAEQAEAIRRLEHRSEAADTRQLTIVAEIAGYVGSVIALVGGAAIVGPNWNSLGLIGQMGVALAIALVGLLAGRRLTGIGEQGAQRLAGFLWVIGTGGLAMASLVAVDHADPTDDAWLAIAAGLTITLASLALWRNRERPLQLATAATGALIAGGGVAALTDVPFWVVAPVVQASALALAVAAHTGAVRPRLVGLMISAVTLMIGSFLYADESQRVAALMAVAAAAAIIAYSLRDRAWPLVGLGVVALFIAMTSAMQTVLHGLAARLVAVVIGLAVVAGVAVRAQRTNR